MKNLLCCELFKKLKGDPFETLKIFQKKNKKSKNKNFEPFSECRKLGRGDPLGFSKLQFAVKYQENLKGTLWRQKKIEKNVAQCRKNSKGDPMVSSGFVSYDKNGVTERGTPCTISNAFPVCRSSSSVGN